MGYSISDNIQEALDRLQKEICRDNYNLAQIDQDAILVKIQQLKEFIAEQYNKRKVSNNI